MVGASAIDVAVFLGYCAIALVTAAGFARRLRGCPSLARVWSSFCAATRPLNAPEEKDLDQTALVVWERIQQLRHQHFRCVCCGFCLMVFLRLGILSAGLAGSDSTEFFSLPQEITSMLLHGIGAMFMFYPGVLSPTQMDAVYSFLVLCGTVAISPWFCPPHAVMRWVVIAGTLAMVLGVARRPTLRCGSVGLLLVVSASSTIATAETVVVQPVRLIIIMFVVCYPLPLLLSRLFENSMASAIRRACETEATGELLSAAVALLRSCCDVVVELDPEDTITSPTPELAVLLLQDRGRDLQGSNLSELMAEEEERAAFLGQLREQEHRPSGTGLAEALHVRLRDADRNVVRAELLWFKFHRLDGQPRYMLGLREFDDTLAVSGRRPPRCRDCGASGEEPREERAREEEEEPSGPSRSDSCGAESADLLGLQEAQLAVVVVDCTRRDLLVKGYSSAFRLCLGRLRPGARLADLVEDGEAFADWAQLAADADARGEDFPDTRATLNMRRGPFHASCRLLRSREGEFDLRRTQLLLFDVSGDRHSVGSRGSTASLRGTPARHASL